MSDPNINATAESNANKLDGIDDGGNLLPWRKVAMLFDSHFFGLSKDYAFPEGSNTSASVLDQVATEAKLLTRTRKMIDGNSYDIHDAVFTILKWVLTQSPHIHDDEKNSVNHKP